MTETFLRAVRRRLRLAWAVATGQLLAPAALGAAVVLTAAGRVRPIGWADPAALIAVTAAVLALVATALLRRISLSTAARAADRGLDAHDAFATALEIGSAGPGFGSRSSRGAESSAGSPAGSSGAGTLAERVHERARSLTSGRTARDAVRLHLQPKRLAVSALLLVAALGLGVLPNPQDEVVRQRAAERALLDEQARRLSQAAAELQRIPAGRAQQAGAEELERAARELRAALGLDTGRQALDQAAARLARQIDPNLLGMKAAVRGLDKSLAAAPLPGSSEALGAPGAPGAQDRSAASQLAAAARSLSGLTPEQRSALASRLDALAAAQQAGDPGTAEALSSAAGALRSGDLTAAAGALTRAGAEHAGAQGTVRDQEGAAGAMGSLALSADALAAGPANQAGQGQAARQGQGQGQGHGQGQGQGQGAGQSQGRGNGQGQAQGRGNGGGGAGRVTGNNATTGSGQGGAGRAAGTGRNATVGVQTATVYDPPIRDSVTDQVGVQGRPGAGSGQVVGQGDLTDPANAPLVPLTQAFPRYQARASEALPRLDIPPSMRAVVRTYFESLDAR